MKLEQENQRTDKNSTFLLNNKTQLWEGLISIHKSKNNGSKGTATERERERVREDLLVRIHKESESRIGLIRNVDEFQLGNVEILHNPKLFLSLAFFFFFCFRYLWLLLCVQGSGWFSVEIGQRSMCAVDGFDWLSTSGERSTTITAIIIIVEEN